MASTFTSIHGSHSNSSLIPNTVSQKRASKRGVVANFLADLFEDVTQKPLQAAEFAKHDIFREHILAMSISYFALILLLIGASVPMLGYLMKLMIAN
jgi:hypothetical protein